MSYQHIPNLYQDQRILAFKRCFATEKVHGTSAHVRWVAGQIRLSPGGESAERFHTCFDIDALHAAFVALGHDAVTVYGEAYGGKQQGMSGTYGKALCFIAFEVRIGETWLAVPQAAYVAGKLGLEFVPWAEGPCEVPWLDEQRNADSEVAIRRGMGPGKTREGIVVRPPFEAVLNNGERLIAKHKRDEFREMATPRQVDPGKQAVLADAEAIAQEWVTDMRLRHVLQDIPEPHGIGRTGDVVRAMVTDVLREAGPEIVASREASKAIGAAAAKAYRRHLATVTP